ncbi:hypothetical protein [Reyranella sp.]|uniref:hypothetical protein n=1 Tax=Reyranella sp. TaxID=1929291 RepID=UPI003BAA878D
MATLTVNLSATLQGTLNQQNVYAWAVLFNGQTGAYEDSYQLAGWNGTSQVVAASTPITLDEPLNGGKLYLIIQSVDPGAATPIAPLTFGSGNTITQESDVSWTSATALDFRYDSFEVSLLGLAGDAGNLTDVNGFGIPMSVAVTYPNGATAQTRGYAVNGASVFSDIDTNVSSSLLYAYSQGPLAVAGHYRMAASPATAVSNSLPGPSASDWNGYVESLGASGASGVRIAGYFNGAPSVEWTTYNGAAYQYLEYHNPGFYSYTLTYQPGTGTSGTYVFTPAANSQIQGTISISTADLANSIYSTLGNATVTAPDGTPYQFSSYSGGTVQYGTDMNTGANNEWGAFFVKLLTGFIGGYLGGTATPQNSLLGSQAISLSENWNFDPTFAFGGQAASGQPGAVTPWTWSQATYGAGVSYDPFAEIFFQHTNSYGNGYSDALMSLFQQGGPLIATGYSDTLGANPFSVTVNSNVVTVTDPGASTYQAGDLVTFSNVATVGGLNLNGTFSITGVNGGAGTYTFSAGASVKATSTTTGGGSAVIYQKDVQAITLTLFDDNEAAAGGQTLAQHQGYTPTAIYDTSSGPFVAPQSSTGAPNLSLVVSLGLGQMRPDPSSTVKVGFYTGTSNGLAQFDYVTVPSSSTESLYQTWVYGNGAFTAGGGASPSGSILQLNGLPYDTGINWYQIQISNGTATRTFNLYADAVAGTGLLNPYYDQGGVDQSGSLALDGLAQIPAATLPATQQYTTSLTIAAFNGGTLSMDPNLMTLITDASVITNSTNSATWPKPLAPVLGTLSGDTFTNWGGSENYTTANTAAALGAVTAGNLAIGWMGSDMNWVGYNAAHAGGAIQVIGSYTNKVSGLDVALITFTGTAHNAISAHADIDGKWVTAASQFGNGTYTATMTEYLSGDTTFKTPVANASSPLTFTVDIPTLAFAHSNGSVIQLDGASGAAGGNWIRMDTVGSSMPNGTLLVYLTDLDGNLVGRDGETGTGVTFGEAVLARIGAVASDGGAFLFHGGQSVYLPVGHQLHFAVQTGDGTIQLLPSVAVTGSDSLAVKVDGTFGTLNLTAHVDNTLSSAATLAGSQREYDQPWLFLNQGQQATIEVAGSAQNTNTIHMVHLDVDGAGNWSVGGVAYGNTDAFRAAVQANWDPGIASTGGGGTFHGEVAWTASSGTGFYAPVLVTQSGDIFVIGNANVDGRDHIRMYGENTFGFEDLRADQHSDFDYNDLVMKLTLQNA